jgi:hypothetical protein
LTADQASDLEGCIVPFPFGLSLSKPSPCPSEQVGRPFDKLRANGFG